jgi:opine dehydrogenase
VHLAVDMNVAVIGSGNGGMAVGFCWAQHGHRVAVYSPAEYADNIDAVRAKGGSSSAAEVRKALPVAAGIVVSDLGGLRGAGVRG